MLKLFKKILAVVLVIASVTSMVVKVASNKSLRERQIVLSFWGTNLPYQFALEEVARQYNEMQDKYEVVIDKQDAGNYRTWMGARLAGGNASDLLATTIVYANTDASNGYLYDLSGVLNKPNPYNDSGRAWKDDFSGTYLTQVAYANDTSKYYCVPTSTVSVRFVINTDILTQNGIAIPNKDWTFSDFRRICEKLEAKGYTALEIANGQYISYMVSWLIDIMMNQLKYDAITEFDVNKNGQVETEEIVRAFTMEEGALNFRTDQDFKEVMQFLKIWSKYWGEGFNSRKETSENFLRQDVPMMFCGSWGVAGIELTLNNKNPEADKTNPYKMFNYISLPVPRLEKLTYIDEENPEYEFTNLKKGLPLQELGEPSGCFCIPKATAESGKLEGVIDFLQFFTSSKMASYMANASYEIPVVKDVQVNEKMYDFLPPENSESVRMRFNLLNLSDGVAEEYHFKQIQMYLMDDVSLSNLCKNIQQRYIDVTWLLKEDNGWEW